MKKSLGLLAAAALMLQLQSCIVKKPYEQPLKVTQDLTVFRINDYTLTDTQTIADISWQDYFSDPQLIEYIQLVLTNNNDNKIALLNLQSSEQYLLQSKNAFAPNLSISPGVSYNTQSLNTQFGQIIGERRHLVQYDLTASLSWELDIWGKIASQRDARQAQYLGTMAGQKALETRLISQVASIYYQLLSLDEQDRILVQTIDTRSQNLEVTQALFEAGQLTQVAVLQSEALYHNAQALLIQIRNQKNVLENTFNVLLDRPMQEVKRGNWSKVKWPQDWTYGVPYQLLTKRPDVLAAEYNLVSNFQMTNVARSNFYPSLKISASSGFQSIDVDKIFNPLSIFGSVVGSLTQPIFNQRNIKTNYEVALNNQQIAYLQYRNTIITATKEVSDALNGIESYSAIEKIKESEYQAYHVATQYSSELLDHGMANYLEVLRAQENELNAQLSLLNAQYNKYISYVQLYRALGGGWK